MTTLHEVSKKRSTGTKMKLAGEPAGRDRRIFRRHDLEQQSLTVGRHDGRESFGQLIDLSAGGVRIRARGDAMQIRPDSQIRVKLDLPPYAGICPFVDTTGHEPSPKREWTGWLTIARVTPTEDGEADVAGRLVDMDEMDRGMLGLYLSTQPLAA